MTTTAFASPPAQPLGNKIVTYTFGNASGSPYCNGIELDQTGYYAVGYGLYTNCGNSDVNAGGFEGKIKKLDRNSVWTITTTDPNGPGNTYVYVIDEKAMQWQVWGMSNTGSSFTFAKINSGELLLGYSTAKRHGNTSATQVRP
jgi:hypothetical protein